MPDTSQNYFILFQGYGDQTSWSYGLGWNVGYMHLTGTGVYNYKGISGYPYNGTNTSYGVQIRNDYYKGTVTVTDYHVRKYYEETRSYTKGSKFGSMPTPTQTGQTFLGWYTAESGGTQVTTDTIAPNDDTTYYGHWSTNSYYLDLNGLLDGVASGNIAGYGTADVWVDGVQVANDVYDFWRQYPYGTPYEIKDIKAKSGYTYNGVSSGSLTGYVGGSNCQLNFTKN